MIEFFSSFTSEISTVVSGIASGLIASFIFYLYQKKKENKEKSIVDIASNIKSVPKNILDYIRPGLSIEKMREIMGVPNFIFDKEYSGEDFISTNKYEYRFNNMFITIISQDGKSIDSVESFIREYMDYNVEFSINSSVKDCRGVIGKSVITSELLGGTSKVEPFTIDRQDLYKVITYHGRFGHFNQYSFYCYSEINYEDDNWKFEENADKLIGKRIIGFRISRNDNLIF
jgi:hypothetical protein